MTGHVYKKKRPAGAEEERVIMHEGDASSSVTSESDHADPSRARSFRHKLDLVVHSTKFQIFIVSLVVFNCLVVIVELLINLRIFELAHQQDRMAAKVLHHMNVAVLGLFVVEMAVKVLAMGSRFLKHRMEMFDAAVVLAAFTLGLALTNRGDNAAHGVSLLVMLRLWRVTKILNSMVASVKHEADRRMAKERRARKALERDVYKLREYCLQQECELQMYRIMLQQNGIPQPAVLRPPPAPRTLNVVAEVNEHKLQQLQQHADARRSQSPPVSTRSASPESTATV